MSKTSAHSFSFLVNMQYSFQDAQNLYLVMDLMNGGDLRYHIAKHRKFSEEQTSKCLTIIIQSSSALAFCSPWNSCTKNTSCTAT